jgi:endonuclease YncB( thermonuclease family)
MFRVCSLFFALALGMPALADVAGRVSVTDGDTILVGDVRVRLFGIDAPEGAQTCQDPDGRQWECGAWVTAQVTARYDGAFARCEAMDTDRYNRIVARCLVDGRDMAEALVRDGLAVAYREYSWDYDLAEKAAQVAAAGIWAGQFQNPAEYRADQRPAEQTAPGDCVIKGNISGSGQIYHMPHNRDYGRTQINEDAGERWFCTEAEARAAGWRPARN